MIRKKGSRFSERIMAERRDRAPWRFFRHGSGSMSALVFAAGAVALWSTNALVGKSLLASHPVSQVQFLQFSGAALVFAVIRLASPSTLPEAAPDASAGAKASATAIGVGLVGLVGTMVLQYIA